MVENLYFTSWAIISRVWLQASNKAVGKWESWLTDSPLNTPLGLDRRDRWRTCTEEWQMRHKKHIKVRLAANITLKVWNYMRIGKSTTRAHNEFRTTQNIGQIKQKATFIKTKLNIKNNISTMYGMCTGLSWSCSRVLRESCSFVLWSLFRFSHRCLSWSKGDNISASSNTPPGMDISLWEGERVCCRKRLISFPWSVV